MLNIINNLRPFFEDCYRRINIREYARLMHISPPTASKALASYHSSGLLVKQKEKIYIYYYANKQNRDFIDLSRMYWRHRLSEAVQYIEQQAVSPTIILYGSLAKG